MQHLDHTLRASDVREDHSSEVTAEILNRDTVSDSWPVIGQNVGYWLESGTEPMPFASTTVTLLIVTMWRPYHRLSILLC